MKSKSFSPMLYVAFVEFLAVTVLSVLFKVEFYNALPLMISTTVMFMQTRVNRYTFILGGLNAIVYSFAFFHMELYGQAAMSLVVSFPLQMITFINWQKHTHKGKTEIKRFSLNGRVAVFAGMAVMWTIFYIILSASGSEYIMLDNTVTVIGTVSSVICIFRYSEFAVLQMLTSFINIVLFTNMTFDNTSRVIWLIHSIYTFICATVTFIKTQKELKGGK